MDRAALNREANRTGFIRDNLEKVYRLLDILEFIDGNSLLKDSLVLKGGTAINLAYFDLPRLSVDIDLDFDRSCSRSEMLEARQEINEMIGRYMAASGYMPDDERGKNAYSLSSGVYTYQNSAGNRDNIKIEINYLMRNHVLEPVNKDVRFDFMIAPIHIRTLNKTELFGSKIKALLERTAARDLFDINNMIKDGIISESEQDMLRKCVLFYKTVGSTGAFNKEISLESIDRLTFSKIRQTLLPVLRKSAYVDLQGMKNDVKKFLSDLMVPTEKEKLYLAEFERGYYKPELLFDDKEILERIEDHPMAVWKTSKIRDDFER